MTVLTRATRTKPSGSTVLSWDAHRFDEDRTVTLYPWDLSGTIHHLDIAERGALLTLFCRYWYHEGPVDQESVRLQLGISKKRWGATIKQLVQWGAATVHLDGRASPGGALRPPERADAPGLTDNRPAPAAWADLRAQVFERDAYGCVYCGSGADLHCDHVHPIALGGSNDLSNLVTACALCNQSKGSKTLAEWRPEIYAFITQGPEY